MNVWAVEAPTLSYFKKIDEIVMALFNRPIEEQPKGILDMGLWQWRFDSPFEVIEQRTKRGSVLGRIPFVLVRGWFTTGSTKSNSCKFGESRYLSQVIWETLPILHNWKKDIQKATLLNWRICWMSGPFWTTIGPGHFQINQIWNEKYFDRRFLLHAGPTA